MLPILRMTNKSPGSEFVMRFGTTRESTQEINSVCGSWCFFRLSYSSLCSIKSSSWNFIAPSNNSFIFTSLLWWVLILSKMCIFGSILHFLLKLSSLKGGVFENVW